MMTKAEAMTLKQNDRVRVLCDGRGGVCSDGGEDELEFKAGEIVTVDFIDTFRPPQGFAVTICAANGVVNVFDERDFGGLYPFAKLA